VLALQFVNRPQDVDSIYNAMGDMEDFDLDVCVSCEYRYFAKGMANLELDRVEDALELLAPYARTAGHEFIKEVLMNGYIRNGDDQAAVELLEHIRLLGRIEYWQVMMLKAGLEYLKIGKTAEANSYFDQILAFFNEKGATLTQGEKELQAEITFYAGAHPKAQELLENLLPNGIDRIANIAYLAMSYYSNGDEVKAQETIGKLNDVRKRYQFGDVDYAFAQYYAFTEDEDKSMEYLLKAVAAGKRFTSTTFQNDLLFKPYNDSGAFQKVLQFWYN
ncbi:MAG: hypothetical protein KJN75_02070, partial [Muriicola sp.]|nr:hypothetical protein [Muriicola sp.]